MVKGILVALSTVVVVAATLGYIDLWNTTDDLYEERDRLEQENQALTDRVARLEDEPQPAAVDLSEIEDSLRKLRSKVNRIDLRTFSLPGRIQDNYDYFDECVDDLLNLVNGGRPTDGFVC